MSDDLTFRKNELRDTIAVEIDHHHQLATKHAATAIDHARRAGDLLLKVKGDLQHGEFQPWLVAHCSVSVRQAQRYMRAAQGKPMSVRAIKGDTASHLAAPHLSLPRKSGFAAIPDHAMWTKRNDTLFMIEQSTTADHFFVSRIVVPVDNGDVVMDCLTRPIRGDYVDLPLNEWGLSDPASFPWRWLRQDVAAVAALTPAAMATALEVRQC